MDGTRFDDLTRRFGQLLSRRRLFALSAGVTMAPIVRGRAVAQQNLCDSDPPCPTDYNGIPGNCFTFETTAGDCACLKSVMSVLCDNGDPCLTDGDCGAGAVCGDSGCSDGQGRCINLCPDRATSGQGPSDDSGADADSFSKPVVLLTCSRHVEDPPQLTDALIDPAAYRDAWSAEGCQPVDGATIEARTFEGEVVASCVTAQGICSITGRTSDIPLQLIWTGDHPDFTYYDGNTIDEVSLASPYPLGQIYSQPAASEPAVSDSSPVSGDLAYSVKNGDHWDIWVYSFDTQQNTQLTSESNSDQWAPAYSHDGTRLAYLSDQSDGSNQIWLMDPDGGNQRQITDWHGAESILYVGWSPDDSQLIVTLFGDVRRLVLMPSGGGQFTDYVGPSSSFATTAPDGTLVYALDFGDAISTSIYLGAFANPASATAYAQGDTPNISSDAAYVLVQIGDPGFRHVESYPLSASWSALPPPARAGDDSNPVWLTGNHDYLAFASAGPNGESIQVCQVGDVSATALAIAPHDRVWYLSKRFTGESSVGASTGASGQQSESIPTSEPAQTASADVSNGNGYASAEYGYSLEWASVWEEQPEYSGTLDDGTERLVLWHTGNVIASVDLRAGGSVAADLSVCVEYVVDQLRGENRFEDNIVPYDAPALVPAPGAEGRTVWNFLQRDYLYTYVECRELGNGSGTLRIVYQVPDDTYAKVYPDVVELLQSIQTG